MSTADLQIVLDELCGAYLPWELAFKRESVFSRIQYGELDDEGKCHLAAFHVRTACPTIGASSVHPDVREFLEMVIAEAGAWPRGMANNHRRLEHILYAMKSFAGPHSAFATSPGALAATYLLTQLEYIFRLLGSHLNSEGAFKTTTEREDARAALGICDLRNEIYRIHLTYKIMLLNPTCHAVRHFASLDRVLPKSTIPTGAKLNDIGDRLAYMRDPAAHGAAPDISSEGLFYSLLMAMVVFGSGFFERTT